jgi:hypothetical protein
MESERAVLLLHIKYSRFANFQSVLICVASFLVLKILLCVKFFFQFPLAQKNGTYQQVWTLFDTKHGKKECARQLCKQGYELNPRDPMHIHFV